MQPKPHRFGLFPVRSPLLRESLLFSLPPGTEMFQFPGLAAQGLCIQPRDDISSRCRVAPFGNPRIKAYLQLPVAYRSLSRPSSPAHAKASTMRPYLLKPLGFLHKSGFAEAGLRRQAARAASCARLRSMRDRLRRVGIHPIYILRVFNWRNHHVKEQRRSVLQRENPRF